MAGKQEPLSASAPLPRFADTVVIGGGTVEALLLFRLILVLFLELRHGGRLRKARANWRS